MALGVLVQGACGGSPPTEDLMAAENALHDASAAQNCAPEEYRAAERLLDQARQANQSGDYDRARILAQSAREQAERARLLAQANAEDCVTAQQSGSTTEIIEHPETTAPTDHQFDPVYFTFDSSSLDDRARQVIQGHAQYLSANSLRVVVEGHCDHFGTDEYNLVLGEQRARSVAQYLISLGIAPDRVSTISYGEFRPASTTDTALNRRAEFRVRP